MKNRFSLILFFLVACVGIAQASEESSFSYSESPITTKSLSVEEYKRTLLLNQDSLELISTEALLEKCLDYPYISDIFFYDNINDGINALAKEHNGWKELLSRDDKLVVMVKSLQHLSSALDITRKTNEVSRGHFSIKCFVLEYLISQDENLLSISNTQKGIINSSLNIIRQERESNPAWLGNIHDYAMNLITDRMTRKTLPTRSITPASVYTPNGTLVNDTYIINEYDYVYSQDELSNLANYLYVNYNGAVLLAQPSVKYNCHAYAWHMSEGGTEVWMGYQTNTAENVYWTDNSYTEVPECIATKVSYPETANHSAIRVDSIWYISKWGAGPLVRHHPDDCPYSPTIPRKYYGRYSITGPTVPDSVSVYAINNLPSNCNINWSYSGTTMTTATMTTNSPSQNQCTISNPNKEYIKGTLTANVTRDGNTLITLSKTIHTCPGFSGTYEQDGGNVIAPFGGTTYYAPIPLTAFEDGETFEVNRQLTVTLTSDKFYGATITHSGENVSDWTHSGNTISFMFPRKLNCGLYDLMTVSGTYNNSYESFMFSVQAKPVLIPINPNFSPFNILNEGRIYSITLSESDADTVNRAVKNVEWDYSVADIITGMEVASSHVKGCSATFNATGWASGIYAIKIRCENQVITKKIRIE